MPAAKSVVLPDVDPGSVVLDVVRNGKPSVNVAASVTAGSFDWSIEGACAVTLTVRDPGMTLLRSGVLETAVDVRIDNDWFRLTQIRKSGRDLELTLEDRTIAYLRQHDEPRKASRGKVTRAEFALMLIREVKKERIRLVAPELHKRQPIRKPQTETSRRERRDPGIDNGARLQGKEGPLSREQMRNAERVLDVADSRNAGAKATLALAMACLIEGPDFKNPTGGDGDSVGILQLRRMHLGGSTSTSGGRRDIELVARLFLERGFTGRGGAIELARRNPSWTAGQVAQAVQGSDHPGRYDQVRRQAAAIVEEYKPGGSTAGPGTVSRRKSYEFTRGVDGKKETTWDCLGRLFIEEVRWRRFIDRTGAVVLASDDTLIRAKPHLRLSEASPGVDWIDFDWDAGKPVATATVTCRAETWAAPPGSVVVLEDLGVANGRWLVGNLSRQDLYSPALRIDLVRPQPALREPAPELATTSTSTAGSRAASDGGGGGSGDGLEGSKVQAAYDSARKWSARRLPYVWGGGHGPAGVPSAGTGRGPGIGFDCSGGISAMLHDADLLGSSRGEVSGWFETWGEPGPGKYLTIYANGGHVFAEFNMPGKGIEHVGTGRWGSSWGGFGFKPTRHPHAGFRVRHFPGT